MCQFIQKIMSKLKEWQSRLNVKIDQVGLERIAHFLVAAWVVAECKAYGIGVGCIGSLVIVTLAFVKEKFLDKYFSASDFWYSALGGFTSLALMALKDMIG